ncbi:MAG: hypothetical protein M3P51_13625 [Chloroflexota bacterium]|nr:hypothetical protein [Chloroflexota bacterium]
MASAVPVAAEGHGGWPGPLDPDAYDRTPVLDTSERAALADLLARLSHDRWRKQVASAVPRLVEPITDVLALMQLPPQLHRRVVRTLLLETDRLGRPFWSWWPEEWYALLGRCHASWRYTVVAVAYLLCGVTDLPVVRGAYYLTRLARRALGPADVEAAEARVVDAARGWGFKDNLLPALASATCEALLLARSPRLEDVTDEIVALLHAPPVGTPMDTPWRCYPESSSPWVSPRPR